MLPTRQLNLLQFGNRALGHLNSINDFHEFRNRGPQFRAHSIEIPSFLWRTPRYPLRGQVRYFLVRACPSLLKQGRNRGAFFIPIGDIISNNNIVGLGVRLIEEIDEVPEMERTGLD